jgi:thioredoxin-related protein
MMGISFVMLGVSGCGMWGDKSDEKEEKPFGETGIPPQLRAQGGQDGSVVEPGGNRPSLPANFQIVPDEDLIFTDPDNPDAVIPELATVLAEQDVKRGPWEQSETLAKRRAMREGKALLIWFTDSGRSPMCKALDEELFATPEFNQWAASNVVRLKVDSNLAAIGKDQNLTLDQTETLRVDVRNYVESMRKRYRVLGSPAVVMLDSEGKRLAGYRGYKRGEAQVYFGKLRHSQSVAQRNAAGWRKKLEARGYREWRDSRGRVTIFAKLAAYRDGELVLVEPDGSRAKTREKNLSAADREWIAEEKRKRGM